MRILKRIQMVYSGIDAVTGKTWFDNGSSINVIDGNLDVTEWIKTAYAGPDIAIVTMAIEDGEELILIDQKTYALVKNKNKIVGVMAESFDFKPHEDTFGIVESNANLFDLRSYYSEESLLLLIDAAIANGDKETFLALTAELNNLKGGE